MGEAEGGGGEPEIVVSAVGGVDQVCHRQELVLVLEFFKHEEVAGAMHLGVLNAQPVGGEVHKNRAEEVVLQRVASMEGCTTEDTTALLLEPS